MSEIRDEGSPSITDRFLKDARDTHQTVSLYLASGFQLKGEIIDFDKDTLLFKHKNVYQLVMRAAVATMYPAPNPKGGVDEWWRSYAPTTG